LVGAIQFSPRLQHVSMFSGSRDGRGRFRAHVSISAVHGIRPYEGTFGTARIWLKTRQDVSAGPAPPLAGALRLGLPPSPLSMACYVSIHISLGAW